MIGSNDSELFFWAEVGALPMILVVCLDQSLPQVRSLLKVGLHLAFDNLQLQAQTRLGLHEVFNVDLALLMEVLVVLLLRRVLLPLHVQHQNTQIWHVLRLRLLKESLEVLVWQDTEQYRIELKQLNVRFSLPICNLPHLILSILVVRHAPQKVHLDKQDADVTNCHHPVRNQIGLLDKKVCVRASIELVAQVEEVLEKAHDRPIDNQPLYLVS